MHSVCLTAIGVLCAYVHACVFLTSLGLPISLSSTYMYIPVHVYWNAYPVIGHHQLSMTQRLSSFSSSLASACLLN